VSGRVHNIAQWIAQRSVLDGRRVAVVDEERALSFVELESRCARAARLLATVGIRRGDRVALLLSNRSATLELVFASARLGAIVVPLNTRLAAPELAELFDDCRPRALFAEAELGGLADRACASAHSTPAFRLAVGGTADAYEAALASAAPLEEIAEVSPEDPLILMYTSGTTGVPKGALLPHRKSLFNSLNAQLFFEIARQDKVLCVVPLFHSFGLQILALPALYAGAQVILQRHFDPLRVWGTVAKQGITYLGGVPSMFRGLLEALETIPFDLSSLRFLFTAGAASPVPLIRAFEAHGLCLKQGFGQTESSILCCLDSADAIRKAGSVGKPVFHAELRIVRTASLAGPPDQWQDCSPGEDGEIVVRGPITMLGYWARPEATAETLRQGWLRTGDMGHSDEEGFVTLSGRARDLFISGGENVYPRQVESVYEAHPDIAEIAVTGVPDPRWGEVGRAFVVLSPGVQLDEAALIAWGRERLARFKVPRTFVAVPALPRTVTGKVQKFRLPHG